MRFRLWFENNEVETAILSAIGDPNNEDEQDRLLNVNTKDLFANQLDQLKNLGIIKDIAEDDSQRYNLIISMIKHGILIKDLIQKVAGGDQFPLGRDGKNQIAVSQSY